MEDELQGVLGKGEQDGPPPGEEAWKAETKAIERVISVALSLDRPRTADWIADEAAVAPQTARDHLASLSELSIITQTTARGVTKYQLDTAYMRFREVSEYVEKYEKDHLMDVADEAQEQIQETKQRYEVEDSDELRAKATEPETTSSEIQEYKKAASEWETLEYRLDVIEEAIERYDEFSRPEVHA
ncbi:DUF7342 family protein [Halobacterium hubeiense]|uniref:DUF7342 family protein n=1 Tax=Halobacterium hubeiense TaxID=1407499 RepID=UPI000B7DAF5F|nr:hypothetical protein [Halobacterium hubeiense]